MHLFNILLSAKLLFLLSFLLVTARFCFDIAYNIFTVIFYEELSSTDTTCNLRGR